MSRLLQQISDLEEFKEDLDADEYEETLQDTKQQLVEFKEALDKITEGDVTLLDALGRMKLAVQAAISDAFKTPEVLAMFTKQQPGQLRQRLLHLEQALKLRKIGVDAYNERRVEVLSALQKLGDGLSAEEEQFLSQHMTRAMRDFEHANNEIGQGTQQAVLNLASSQVKRAEEGGRRNSKSE